jgi:hypothetical protein
MTTAWALLGMLPLAWFLLRARTPPPRTRLRLVASNLGMLDHLCISMGGLLREWPELEQVCLSVDALSTLDDASIECMKAAIHVATRARVDFRLDGYNVGMARLAIARGVEARYLGMPRPPSARAQELLH